MPSASVPAEVQQFIVDYIQSAEQLDILILLFFEREQEWEPEAVSKRVFTTPSSAQGKLDSLVEAGFLAKTGSGRYRYAPGSPQLHAKLELLGAAYRENRGAVLEAVFAKNLNPVKSFADAFRFGK